MTLLEHRFLWGCSLLGLALAAALLILRFHHRHIERTVLATQGELNQLQQEINRGAVLQRTGQNLLQDLAPLAASKLEIQNLMTRYGIVAVPSAGNPTP